MTAIPLSAVIGGPISGALLGLNGWLGLAGWQWLFLLEGLPAAALGLIVLRFLPDRPEQVEWLAPEQRTWLANRLASEHDERVEHRGDSVVRALTNGVVWQLGLLLFLSTSFGQYALTLWMPQIVRGLSGLTDLQIGLVTAIPNVVAVMVMVLVASHSDRTRERCIHIAAVSAVSSLGFLGCALVRSPVPAVMFLVIAAAGISAHGPFWPLPSMFLTGAAAAGGIALINSLAALSGFAGPYAVGLLTSASGDVRSGLLALAGASLVGAGLALRLRRADVLRDSP